jgi:Gti1/Pac2 family transcription factor
MHGSDHHLVSYYTEEDINSGRFSPLSSRDDIMSLDLPLHIFTFSDFRIPPRLETGRDGLPTMV